MSDTELDKLFYHIEKHTCAAEALDIAHVQEVKAAIEQKLTDARIDEREIAIAQLDGVYQACVRDNVLTPDGLNGYHCAIEDACKDRDDRKIELQASKEGK